MEKEELLQNESEQKNVADNVDYIEAIREIKENTVNKGDYLKLKEENKKLINALANGERIEQAQEIKVDIEELRNNLFNKELNNLDYITNALALREELMKQGEKDPFLPYGKNIMPTNEDIETAQRVADVLQECVDIAEGDSASFTIALQNRTLEGIPFNRRK